MGVDLKCYDLREDNKRENALIKSMLMLFTFAHSVALLTLTKVMASANDIRSVYIK